MKPGVGCPRCGFSPELNKSGLQMLRLRGPGSCPKCNTRMLATWTPEPKPPDREGA